MSDINGVEDRYMNWLAQLVNMISPKDLYLYLGRGSAKTTDILAERLQDVCEDMPGCYIACVSDTYMNAAKNILPNLIDGLQRKGWIEGIHFVVDQRPPKHFDKPYRPPSTNWKHTIAVHNGCIIKIVSLDRPSTGAGDSYQHRFGDESKYLKKKKLDKTTPAIRGEYVRYHESPFYRGNTFLSDLANPLDGEDDWMLKYKDMVDWDHVELILQTAKVVMDIRMEYVRAWNKKNKKKLALVQKKLERWEERYRKIRMKSMLFYMASSYVNVDVLTPDYFPDQYTALGKEGFSVGVLSIPAKIEKGESFYPALSSRNYFDNGTNYDLVDQYRLREIPDSAEFLTFLNRNSKLEAGFDAGNMMSLVIGQPEGRKKYRIIKSIYTLVPDWIEELAKRFTDYFSCQIRKELDLYYDRSANQYQKAGKDFAGRLKYCIENQDGKRTGWRVNLKSRNQANVTHQDEYDLLIEMLKGENPFLPELLIDRYNAKHYKSSIEVAKAIVKWKGETKVIKKDKNNEKSLPLDKLPLLSTNMSDAGKYLLCRKEWIEILRKQAGQFKSSNPKVYGNR